MGVCQQHGFNFEEYCKITYGVQDCPEGAIILINEMAF